MTPYLVRARIDDFEPPLKPMVLYVATFRTGAEALAAVRSIAAANQVVEEVVGIATDEIVRKVGAEPGKVSTLS